MSKLLMQFSEDSVCQGAFWTVNTVQASQCRVSEGQCYQENKTKLLLHKAAELLSCSESSPRWCSRDMFRGGVTKGIASVVIVLHLVTENKANFFKLRFIHGRRCAGLSFVLTGFIFLY